MSKTIKYIAGGIRLMLLKLLNGRKLYLKGVSYYIGKHVNVETIDRGFIHLGEKTWLSDNCSLTAQRGSIQLGYNNYFNTNAKITSLKSVTIGDNNLFGPNIVIVDHNHRHNNNEQLICNQGFEEKAIVIGSNIWLSANTVITAGVTICDNVVVGANSVVTKSIIESGVYAGAPAVKVKDL